jgi:tripartite-type tricarboxylate transporter receptor subunit TctC
MISRRRLLGGMCATLGAALLSGSSCRQRPVSSPACPQIAGKRIRWIVPNAAGGGYDTESRMIEPLYEKRLGAEIVIENMPGAGGIIGAKTILNARPDGLTIGIINVPGLMVASLTGETDAPNPARDFTILGRVSRSWHVWAVGSSSPFHSIEDLLAEAGKRPIVFAVSEVASANFVSITVSSYLLGAAIEFVAGFSGMRAASLAALRGEVDLVCFNFETILDLVDNGDLRPLLQISDKPISEHRSLAGVPLLGGENGLAMGRARGAVEGEGEVQSMTRALIDLIGAGRVIVAPGGLKEDLFECLELNLYETLTSQGFQSSARNSQDVGRAGEAKAVIESAAGRAEKLLPLIQDAIKKLRG